MNSVEETLQGYSLGKTAVGTIDPGTRSLDTRMVEQLENDVLNGVFDVPVSKGVSLPCACIDGRLPLASENLNFVPNAAGGTLTLLMGELLTTSSNIATTANTSEKAMNSLLAFLQSQGLSDQIGGHSGTVNGSAMTSGCGANDHLVSITKLITQKSEEILSILRDLNISIDKEKVFYPISENAKQLLQKSGYFSTGAEIARTLEAASPDGNFPHLQGEHNEVFIRLNMTVGTTLDRHALTKAYDDDYQVFNVDVWAIENAAETLSYSADEKTKKFVAMIIYQVATAMQLCGPSMRII